MTHKSSFAATIAGLERMGRVPNATPARALVMRRRLLRLVERERARREVSLQTAAREDPARDRAAS